MIGFSINAKFPAKHPPPRFESSEDDSKYFSYSNSFFSEADSDLTLPSDGDMSIKTMIWEMNHFQIQQASNGTKILWRRMEEDSSEDEETGVSRSIRKMSGRYCVNLLSKKTSNYIRLKMTMIDIYEQELGSYCSLGRIDIQGFD
ncbi:hypothetical protein ACOSP7_013177 [Xanthoceras sorbifolium]